MLKFMVCYESAYGFENLISLVWLCKSYDLFHYHLGTTISVPVVAFRLCKSRGQHMRIILNKMEFWSTIVIVMVQICLRIVTMSVWYEVLQ